MRAVLVTPLTGPLARYGRAGAAALKLWAESRGADLTVVDAHPDPAAAMREADSPYDIVFGPYGSGPARAAVRATDRLVFNHGGARVLAADNVVTILAPAETYLVGALRSVDGVRRIAVLHGDTGFGRAVASGVIAEAARLGIEVDSARLPGPPAEADMLFVAGTFESELDAARRFLPGRWRAAAFVGAGVDEVLADLGERREGLLGPAQWLESAAPTPTAGPTAAEFADAYRRATGESPSYPAAQAFAAGVIAERCLAGATGDAEVRAAALALDCVTLFGRFRLDARGIQVGHEVLTVQWRHGRRHVVWPRPD